MLDAKVAALQVWVSAKRAEAERWVDRFARVYTPLMLAVAQGWPRTARLLVRKGADLKAADSDAQKLASALAAAYRTKARRAGALYRLEKISE